MLKSNSKSIASKRFPQQELLLGHVRGAIARGQWRPGQRLPSIQTMAGEFGISSATAQSAVHQLARDGFVEAHHRRGLFVAERPPNRNRFALVFPYRASATRPWSLYWSALVQAAVEMEKASSVRFPIFYDVESAHDTRDFDELVRAVTTDCVAGVIFANSPHLMRGTPVLDHPGVPRAAFMGSDAIPGVRQVTAAPSKWISGALDHLALHGRRRIAMLMLAPYSNAGRAEDPKPVAELRSGVAQRGMETRNAWIQAASPFYSDWSSHIMELMFSGPVEQRPDGLIIHDDNLAESAQRGLAAAGVRVPSELNIVVNCNYPCPPPAVLPMHRMGIDAREILARCAAHMLRDRSGIVEENESTLNLRTDDDTVCVHTLLSRVQAQHATAGAG